MAKKKLLTINFSTALGPLCLQTPVVFKEGAVKDTNKIYIYINSKARHCFQVALHVTVVHNDGFFNSCETAEFKKATEILLNTSARIQRMLSLGNREMRLKEKCKVHPRDLAGYQCCSVMVLQEPRAFLLKHVPEMATKSP